MDTRFRIVLRGSMKSKALGKARMNKVIQSVLALIMGVIPTYTFAKCWVDTDCSESQFCRCERAIERAGDQEFCGTLGGECLNRRLKVNGERFSILDLVPYSQGRAAALESMRGREPAR